MLKNYITMFFLLIFLISCTYVTLKNPAEQQINIRHAIMECETFDCSVLDNEIEILKDMIEKNDINQGIQQSLVTSITRICNSDIEDKETSCYEYNKERNKLKY